MEDHAPEPAQVDTSMLEQVRGEKEPSGPTWGGALPERPGGLCRQRCAGTARFRLGLPLFLFRAWGEVGVSLRALGWLMRSEAENVPFHSLTRLPSCTPRFDC